MQVNAPIIPQLVLKLHQFLRHFPAVRENEAKLALVRVIQTDEATQSVEIHPIRCLLLYSLHSFHSASPRGCCLPLFFCLSLHKQHAFTSRLSITHIFTCYLYCCFTSWTSCDIFPCHYGTAMSPFLAYDPHPSSAHTNRIWPSTSVVFLTSNPRTTTWVCSEPTHLMGWGGLGWDEELNELEPVTRFLP